jgi:hypothetical protein
MQLLGCPASIERRTLRGVTFERITVEAGKMGQGAGFDNRRSASST